MPIYQTNIWVCEICDAVHSTAQEVAPYDDPVVTPPTSIEWGYIGQSEKLACPECMEQHKEGQKESHETQ